MLELAGKEAIFLPRHFFADMTNERPLFVSPHEIAVNSNMAAPPAMSFNTPYHFIPSYSSSPEESAVVSSQSTSTVPSIWPSPPLAPGDDIDSCFEGPSPCFDAVNGDYVGGLSPPSNDWGPWPLELDPSAAAAAVTATTLTLTDTSQQTSDPAEVTGCIGAFSTAASPPTGPGLDCVGVSLSFPEGEYQLQHQVSTLSTPASPAGLGLDYPEAPVAPCGGEYRHADCSNLWGSEACQPLVIEVSAAQPPESVVEREAAVSAAAQLHQPVVASCSTPAPAESGAGGDRPDEPYAKLIYKAFMSRPDHSMTLQEIYQWFRDNTNKAVREAGGWQNSIRHNLSMNAVRALLFLHFVPLPFPSHSPPSPSSQSPRRGRS